MLHRLLPVGLAPRPLPGGRRVRPRGTLCSRQHKPGAAALRFIDLLRGTGNGAAAPGPKPHTNGKTRGRRTAPAPGKD